VYHFLQLAWAPGKGVKGKEWKDYWEVDLGVSYIPWAKLTRDSDLDALEEGGMIDEETVPEWIKSEYGQNHSACMGLCSSPFHSYSNISHVTVCFHHLYHLMLNSVKTSLNVTLLTLAVACILQQVPPYCSNMVPLFG
jgi:hypothetical protein